MCPLYLKTHLQTFLMAYNFARRLKTLKDLTPYEYICESTSVHLRKYICEIWTNVPECFTINTAHRGTEHLIKLIWTPTWMS